MSSNQGTLYIIAAPSGAGKTSLVRALVDQVDHLVISVSHTTRPPRLGEVDNKNYHFVSSGAFQKLLEQQAFLEHAEVFGHCYGTSRVWVTEQLQLQNDVILEIDWQGAAQIRRLFPHSRSIFIIPPSLQILQLRLQERGQDSEIVIEERMRQAKAEISHCCEFDYLVVNDDFGAAVKDLKSIVRTQRLSYARQAIVSQKLLEKLLGV